MTTKLQIFSAVMLCLSAFLVIPKVADATAAFQSLPSYALKYPASESTAYLEQEDELLVETYIPPNYGGPDSEYGSGTR